MKIKENLWNLKKNQWKINGKSMKINENQWKSMKIQWKWMKNNKIEEEQQCMCGFIVCYGTFTQF